MTSRRFIARGSRVLLTAAWLMLAGTARAQDGADRLYAGVRSDPGSGLEFLFEVTFMKIDVADVAAMLPPSSDTALAEAIATDDKSERRARIHDVLVQADPVVCAMTFKRNSDWGRFEKGIARSWETAETCGAVDATRRIAIELDIAAMMAPILERGVLKGDRFLYRVSGDEVTIAFVGVDGNVIAAATRTGEDWTAGVRAAFFCDESRYVKKFIEVAEKRRD